MTVVPINDNLSADAGVFGFDDLFRDNLPQIGELTDQGLPDDQIVREILSQYAV